MVLSASLLVIVLAQVGIILYLIARLDQAYAAGADQVRGLLERLEHLPQVVVAPAHNTPAPQEEKPYISDFEHDDRSWNDFVGANVEDDE